MTQENTPAPRTRKPYRPPALRRRKRLVDIAEGVPIFITAPVAAPEQVVNGRELE